MGLLSFVKSVAPFLIYTVAGVVFFLSLSGKVRYGLLFLIPLLPLQNIFMKLQAFPLGKDLNDILLIAMIVGWVVYKNSQKQPIFDNSPCNKILFFYLIFTYITLWYGSSFLGMPAPFSPADPRVQNWKNYMIFPLLFLLVFNNTKNISEIKRLFVFMCISMFLMDYYTVNQIRWISSWFSRPKLNGTFVWLGPNEVAAFYASYTMVLFGVFLFIKEKRWKIVLGVLILLNLYCDLFLFSRGEYMATLAGLLLISIVRQKKLIIPIALLLIFWQVILPKQVVERIKYTEQGGKLDASAANRLEYWQESINYFKESPLVGTGFNTFVYMGLKRDTHNLFLRTLAEQGIIGLVFLLWIMILALKRGWRLYKNANDNFLKGLGLGFCACVIAVMVGNFFGDRWTYLQLGAYFWVYLGMVERANIITTKELAVSMAKRLRKPFKGTSSELNYEPTN